MEVARQATAQTRAIAELDTDPLNAEGGVGDLTNGIHVP